MTKHIKLDIDDDKYFTLNYFKSLLQRENKKKHTWESFLVDWVISVFNHWLKSQTIDPALEEAMKQIKP